MSCRSFLRRGPRAALPLAALGLGGCSMVLLDPAGDVARQEANLILWATGLMLLIIVPVMALTVLFAWRYRATNEDADYAPDWDHSIALELVIWATPLLIVTALGALTWVGTHVLDPYRPLARTARGKPVAPTVQPLEVQVVSLDWKWLFIYPDQGIATVNRLVLPVDRPVRFRMTSSSVMNTFWVPSMAGMIYTMPGMETKLHAVLNRPGEFEGRSGNYSGAGFSDMTFRTFAVAPERFDQWAASVRAVPRRLDLATYIKLEKPSEKVAPMVFGAVDSKIYGHVVGMCVHPGTSCMGDMGQRREEPRVNDRPAPPTAGKGALVRPADEKGTGLHRDAPTGKAPGQTAPASPANRDMTLLEQPAAPRAAASARA